GSRTWQCTIAAPALAASMAAPAMCLGERGTCGLLSWVAPAPVMAAVTKTFRFICRGITAPFLLAALPDRVAFLCEGACALFLVLGAVEPLDRLELAALDAVQRVLEFHVLGFAHDFLQ